MVLKKVIITIEQVFCRTLHPNYGRYEKSFIRRQPRYRTKRIFERIKIVDVIRRSNS